MTTFHIAQQIKKNNHQLTNDETIELIKQYKSGNEDAGNKLAIGHYGMVLKLTIKYSFTFQYHFNDCLSHALHGLSRAINNYDENKAKFSTFAFKTIKRNILNSIAKDRYGKFDYTKFDFNIKFSSIDDEDFAGNYYQFDKFSNESLEDEYVLRETVNKYLSTYDERTQNIIKLKFGLSGNYIHDSAEIAKIFKISRQRVSQVIDVFLRKAKKNNDMRSFVGLREIKKESKAIKTRRYKKKIDKDEVRDGLCRFCNKPAVTNTLCNFHKDKMKTWSRNYAERKKREGTCRLCDNPVITKTLCEYHRDQKRIQSARNYRKKKALKENLKNQ